MLMKNRKKPEPDQVDTSPRSPRSPRSGGNSPISRNASNLEMQRRGPGKAGLTLGQSVALNRLSSFILDEDKSPVNFSNRLKNGITNKY